MSFWSTQRIEAEQQKQPLVEPFDASRLQQGAYELTLSREVLTTPDESAPAVNAGEGPALLIPPGQFALLYTEERVSIPANVLSFISIKAKIKLKGLVNVSGFHVDPGYSGRLKFSVYNAGNKPLHLAYGKPCFLIWFADLDSATKDPYKGGHNGQNGITTDDRDQMSESSHSPAALHERLEKVEKHLNWFMTITGAIMGLIVLPMLVGVAIVLAQRWFEKPQADPVQPVVGKATAAASANPSPGMMTPAAQKLTTNTHSPP